MSDTKRYTDLAVGFLRGDWSTPGHIMGGARSWLPPGTRFEEHNRKTRRDHQQALDAALRRGDNPDGFTVTWARRGAAGEFDEKPLPPVVRHCNNDGEHWHAFGDTSTAQTEFGRRFLLVLHHGEEQMWLHTFATREELAVRIAEHAADTDYGVTTAIDLETREPITFKVGVTFE